KHGKTELYRDILHHLAYTNNKFEIARGQRGMVMVTFTMPDYDIIIKIIKDKFDPPKKTNHQAVKEKYHLVFMHDRAGRLIDAQKFERLKFDRQYFSEDLLDELQAVAANAVTVTKNDVNISLAYIERRVIPLNIYVNEADEDAARAAVVDYGSAIKDLAATNIFPGDLLLKNFGVSRHGRVLFYDYDEISLLTECKFRRMPPPRSDIDEFSDEPWFAYDEDDIFPEQFPHFLGLRDDLHEVFVQHHSDLFEAAYWKKIQKQFQGDSVPLIYPYGQTKRFETDGLD
ncbi:MAG: bifunctional isocitrate dehydrogenase kinase/phosphatase, partial [Anaerolineae bacterium]|nr:bifunctional isocitrate dehydrogenase kinase/phosphatase [Anaerolineae bacterium]